MLKKIILTLMSMDEATWQRHANPWSVWTRVVTGLPILLSAVWTIKSLGWWSIPPLLIAFFWLWLNPRLFNPPKQTNSWASKVTFGERVWLNRENCPVPKHHANWAMSLSIIAGLGFVVAIGGAYQNLIMPTLLGGVISWFGKMWFCDRMVWLYEDMKDMQAEYSRWSKT